MNIHFSRLVLGLSVPALCATTTIAQEVTVRIVPAKSTVLQYTITSASDIKTERKTMVNGEERAARGGRAGGGATKSVQKLVFQEGPANTGWRSYVTAEASVSRPDRAGEVQTTKIAGALAGKKVFITTEGGRVVLKDQSADGKALPRQVANGVPTSLDFGGLLPKQSLEIDGKYEIGSGLVAALKSIMHPVRAARAGGGQGRGEGGQGRQGRGEGRGQGRGQGRGARGRAGQGANAQTFNASALRIFNGKKLETKGFGKLISIEEKAGQKFATIAIEAVIIGKGTPTELGLGPARRGGRRGGGQRGGAAEDTGKGSVKIEVKGKLIVNHSANRVEALTIDGAIRSASSSSRTNNRGGEDRKIDTEQTTAGTFQLNVACKDLGSPEKSEPKKIRPIK